MQVVVAGMEEVVVVVREVLEVPVQTQSEVTVAMVFLIQLLEQL